MAKDESGDVLELSEGLDYVMVVMAEVKATRWCYCTLSVWERSVLAGIW